MAMKPFVGPLPPGFNFKPKDPVLIRSYLLNKVLGRPLPYYAIKEGVDIYKAHPDHLPIDSAGLGEKSAYFFVFRTPGDENRRSTPCGYWGLIDYDVEYEDEKVGEIVAFRRSLAFYEGTAHDGELTEWRMKEYWLNNELIQLKNPNNPEMENCVACKIYKALEKQGNCAFEEYLEMTGEACDTEMSKQSEQDGPKYLKETGRTVDAVEDELRDSEYRTRKIRKIMQLF